MENNIDNVGKGIGWLEKLVEMSKKYSIWNWLETFAVIFILGVMILGFSHPEKVLNFFATAAQEKHTELMEARRENNVEIQRIADKLLYSFGADRAVLIETHNGASSAGGNIPFLRVSCTFEALNDGVMPIADQYQQVNISLMPFLDYLYKEGNWYGYTTDMQRIDKSLGYKMLSNSTEYFAACLVQGVNAPLGFLILSFDETRIPEDMETVQAELLKASKKMACLLELRNR